MVEQYDTIFSLPSVDDDPDTEIGVLLMGFGPERLLAGLGVACREPDADPATVTMVVDQLRHGVRTDLTFEDAVAAGVARWRTVRVEPVPGTRTAALRRLWESAASAVAAPVGSAERVYLTACSLRPEEITQIVEEHVVLPEFPS